MQKDTENGLFPEKKEKKIRRGRPRNDSSWTAALLNERAERYFEKCDSRQKAVVTKEGVQYADAPEPYSIEGLCCYLDVTKYAFEKWRKEDSQLGERANKIHLRIMANRITGALDGSQNPNFAQFMLKNNNPESYRDKTEVENTVSPQVADLLERSLVNWKVTNVAD